jgi:hypothetical protein
MMKIIKQVLVRDRAWLPDITSPALRFKIGLQQHCSRQIVHVTPALLSLCTHVYARLPGFLRAETFIPKAYSDFTLLPYGFSKAVCLPAAGCGESLLINRFANHDHPYLVLTGEVSDRRCIHWHGDVSDHGERAGNRTSGITDGDADAFFTWVYG